jgi:hypothetical protein
MGIQDKDLSSESKKEIYHLSFQIYHLSLKPTRYRVVVLTSALHTKRCTLSLKPTRYRVVVLTSVLLTAHCNDK